MVGVAHAMGQIRQARLNTWIELKFWVDRIIVIVSDLDLGNPQHDAPGLDIAFSPGSPKEKDQDTLTWRLGGRKFTFFKSQEPPSLKKRRGEGLMM